MNRNNLSRLRSQAKSNTQRSASALDSYCLEIRHLRSLNASQEQVLADLIQKGNSQAVQMLVTANLKFVVAVCRNYENQGLPMGDLINEGNLGLIRAAQRFDGNMNCKFVSYAVWWIRQGILIALAEQSRFLKISPNSVQVIQKLSKVKKNLEQKLGRTPSLDELASGMGLPVPEISKLLQITTSTISLSASPEESDTGSFEENFADRNGTQSDASALQFLLQEKVKRHLDSLSERERQVVTLYFGIGLETTYDLDQIARRFNLTRERIRQIKTKALEKLTHPSRHKTLQPLQRLDYTFLDSVITA